MPKKLSQIEPLLACDRVAVRRAALSALAAYLRGESVPPDPRGHRIQLEIAEAVEAFAQSQVPVVLLKGADLASRAYPRTDLRAMTDIDLWVRPTDAPSARQVLERIGFNRSVSEAAHHWRFLRAGTVIELHFDLFNRPHGLRYDADAVFSRHRLVPLKIEGVHARVLDPVDAALHVIGHATYSDALGTATAILRAPVDVLLLHAAEGWDPGILQARARRWGLDEALDVFCSECGRQFPALLGWRDPAGATRRRWARRLARFNYEQVLEGARPLPASVVRGALAPSWLSSMRVWWGHGMRALRQRRWA